MTAGCAASRRVLARTPVAPLPASSPKRPTGINGRTSAPPEMYLPEVCSFQLPKVCSFRLPLTADAGLGLTRTKQALATLVSNGLVTIRRTGRTNIYTVRIPAAALELVNTTPRRATLESEPWKADGVSRRTWYRDRARTDPKTTHGGKRHEQSVSGEIPVSSGTNRTLSSGTDGQTGSPSDGQTGSPSTVGGSVGSTRTSATRWTCPDCGNDWPKEVDPIGWTADRHR